MRYGSITHRSFPPINLVNQSTRPVSRSHPSIDIEIGLSIDPSISMSQYFKFYVVNLIENSKLIS